MHFHATDSISVSAGSNQGISNLNASGPSTVLFSNASSKIKYKLDQVDLITGKYMQLGKL